MMTPLEAQAIQPVLDMIQGINKPNQMNDMKVIECMQKYGGGFMKALAEAFLKADPINRWKIKGAFDDEWEEYRTMAERMEKAPAVTKCHPLSGMMEPPEDMEEEPCKL